MSVIVPVRDNACGLATTLRALEAQSYPRDAFEIVVVDNGSRDDLSPLKSAFSRVRWTAEAREGSYAARNRGIESAAGEVLAFTDSDCIPDPEWLRAGVGVLSTDASTDVVAGRIEVEFASRCRASIGEIYDALCSFPQRETLERYHYGATANLFVRRTVFERVGLFDPNLRSGGDCEWGYRAHRAGHRQTYGDRAIVRHPARRGFELLRKSRRVTIGTMRTAERQGRRRFGSYVAYHIYRRPRSMWHAMAMMPSAPPPAKRVCVLGLYVAIKILQLGERARVGLGGTPLR